MEDEEEDEEEEEEREKDEAKKQHEAAMAAQQADSAKSAFKAFKVPDEVAETAKKMMEKADDDPKAGVLAKLMQDEIEAVKGYEMAKQSFLGDYRTIDIFDEIIRDEEHHERLLANLWAACALYLGDHQKKDGVPMVAERL